MIDYGNRRESNEVLVVDSNYTRGHSLLAVLGFIKVEARLVTPEQIPDIPRRELYNYLAILSIGGDDIAQMFLERNREDNCKYPVVLLVDKYDLDQFDILVEAPFITGLCFQSDYYSLSQVLDQARKHNKRERRMHTRECQPLVGNSNAIARINLMIDQVADTHATVLISGDAGTGKEVIARNIHAQSARGDKPFVPVNCSSSSSQRLEEELFGVEGGDGGEEVRPGRFELARGGVLFFDEIGDMPTAVQARLLRVLQERSFMRVGGSELVKTDVRVIAATRHSLDALIAEGRFREDLFYRLNVFPIEVPPLRQHRSDIPLLIDEMITRSEHGNRGSVRFSKKAVAMLQRYDWPGNVRELANLIDRLAIQFPHGVVDSKDLPSRYQAGVTEAGDLAPVDDGLEPDLVEIKRLPNDGIDMKKYLADIEVALIEQALSKANNVVARAASMLQIRRTTLVEKMRKYDIDRVD